MTAAVASYNSYTDSNSNHNNALHTAASRESESSRKASTLSSQKKKEFGDVVLELKEIGKSFPIDDGAEVVHALKMVSVCDELAAKGKGFPSIRQGEFVMIRGPSGGGKTTLLNLIGTIDLPTTGTMTLLGSQITKDSDDDFLSNIRLRHIGFVFQTFNLLSTMSALENVELPMTLLGELSEKERRSRAKKLLALVGLRNRIHHLPSELSGGEQQRVTIARSLANNPGLLLLDEPTGDLDTATTIQIMDLLSQINYMSGVTCIMVTHNPDVETYADRILYVEDGRFLRQVVNEEPLPLIREEYEEYLKKVDHISVSSVRDLEGGGGGNASSPSNIVPSNNFPVASLALHVEEEERRQAYMANHSIRTNGTATESNTPSQQYNNSNKALHRPDNNNNNNNTSSINDGYSPTNQSDDENNSQTTKNDNIANTNQKTNGSDKNKNNNNNKVDDDDDATAETTTSQKQSAASAPLKPGNKTNGMNRTTQIAVAEQQQQQYQPEADDADRAEAQQRQLESLFVRPVPQIPDDPTEKRQDSDFELPPAKNNNNNNNTRQQPSVWHQAVQRSNNNNNDNDLPPVRPPPGSSGTSFPAPPPSTVQVFPPPRVDVSGISRKKATIAFDDDDVGDTKRNGKRTNGNNVGLSDL